MPSFVVNDRTVVARNRAAAIRKACAGRGAFVLGEDRAPVVRQVSRSVARLVRAHLAGEVRWTCYGAYRYDPHPSDSHSAYVANEWDAIWVFDGRKCRLVSFSWPEARQRIHGLWGIWVEAPKGLGGTWT